VQEATMEKETFHITKIQSRQNGYSITHKVGAPAYIVEGATIRHIAYRQKDKPHRTNGPCDLFIDKATGTVLYEKWAQMGRFYREDGPFETLRDPSGQILAQSWRGSEYGADLPGVPWIGLRRHPATGAIEATWKHGHDNLSAHERMKHAALLHSPEGPWHRDPDYTTIPDKPKAPEWEREIHQKVAGAFDPKRMHFTFDNNELLHRNDNKPAVIQRFLGALTQWHYIDEEARRTDGGPTETFTQNVVALDTGLHTEIQKWTTGFDKRHRTEGPALITLVMNGPIHEAWYREGDKHTPTPDEQAAWRQRKIEQGGPLWVPPEQRYPDGPNGPSQVLIHPDTGVRWYEARHNEAGHLDRADGPAQVFRNQKTGKILFEQWARNGQPYEPTAEQRLQWEASQRAQTQRPGGVKAAAAAAAAKAAEAAGPKTKTADRGDER
jgi:hypothetical protein